MAASHTVENYLKAIFQAEVALAGEAELVPMGQLAASMGVAPGTATTMVKALADSGLAYYEPYAGVRLTPAGGKLAALVLRRHRLIELFLVKVMGMSWTEVHEEAELLEHAASDRLVERMDEMLGRPEADPHGDPIPGPEGTVPTLVYDSLLTCPLDAPLMIARVTDQDREFLEFAERQALRPGEAILVEGRDAAGDSVQVRNRDDVRITLGTRAASKVLVRTAGMIVALMFSAAAAFAQGPAPVSPAAAEPFRIMDNSFLVEEAFNQEAGIFQNIFGAMRADGRWAGTFTQEWPVLSQAHQLSYTVALLEGDPRSGFGDTLLNYRYQWSADGPGRPAVSPRLSLVLPTGRHDSGLGDGSVGLQVNLPVSKQVGDWHVHSNAGLTWLPRARPASRAPGAPDRESLTSPFLAASTIYRLLPMFHVMLESVLSFDETATGGGTARDTTFTLSPGVRAGWNVGDRQIVAGVALPVSWAGDGGGDAGAFLYFSYELPFGR